SGDRQAARRLTDLDRRLTAPRAPPAPERAGIARRRNVMSLFKNDHADLLDDAVSQVAGEPIDPRQIEEAAARVWAKLSQGVPLEAPAATAANAPAAFAAISDTAPAAPVAGLNSCDDFQSQIPAYLRGELSPARALLVEDHTRNCVP